MPQGNINGPVVRRLADVPPAKARRIEMKVRMAPLFGKMSEYALRQRGPADISGTNKKNRLDIARMHGLAPSEVSLLRSLPWKMQD
jgi:hypothetical protein